MQAKTKKNIDVWGNAYFWGMNVLYYLVMEMVGGLLPLVGVFVPKIRFFLNQRKNLISPLANFRTTHAGPLTWFHVASLGEYEQAKPVIAALKMYPIF